MKGYLPLTWAFLSGLVVFADFSRLHVQAAVINVGVGDRRIEPQNLAINVGDIVSWYTINPQQFDTESYGGEWKSPLSSATQSNTFFSHTFDKAGDFTYRTGTPSGYNAAGRIVAVTWTNSPPLVTLNSPIEGLLFTAPADVLFLASVAQPQAAVERVEFYSDTNLVATATDMPYGQRVFSETGLPAGQHTLTAKVIYGQGGEATSAPVHITVDPYWTAKVTDLVQLPTGQFRLYHHAPLGGWYLKSSETVTHWDCCGLFVRSPGPWVDETTTNVPQRFYRLIHEAGLAPR